MITLILLNVFFVIFAYNFYVYLFSRPTNFPPGDFLQNYFSVMRFLDFLNKKARSSKNSFFRKLHFHAIVE